MGDLIVSVPDHCLSFYFEISTFSLSRQRRRERCQNWCTKCSRHLLNQYFKRHFDVCKGCARHWLSTIFMVKTS